MNFIISFRKKIFLDLNSVPEEFADTFFNDFEKRLKNAYIFHYQRDKLKCWFQGSPFRFVWNGFDFFNDIIKGEIEFRTENGKPLIFYKLFFTELFIIAIMLHLAVAVAVLWKNYFFAAILSGIILVIYIFNCALTIKRFQTYILKLLVESSKK